MNNQILLTERKFFMINKLGKNETKSVSGGGCVFKKDKFGKTTYLLYEGDTFPDEIVSIRDRGEATKYWAENGKLVKEFVSENGVTGISTQDTDVARAYFGAFN